MGSSASKAARKYPEAVSKAFQSEVKKHSVSPVTSTGARLAESQRSEAIERDAADPHFLANLNKLGPVRVDHHMQAIRPEAKNTKQLFESRESSENAGRVPNRLNASSISQLLDRHKGVTTHEELVALADEFKIDADRLSSLGRFVNSPSVDEASIRPAPGSKKAEDVFIANAVWVESGIGRP